MSSKKSDRIYRRVGEYVDLCERCLVCYWPKFVKSWERVLEVHHISGRGKSLDYWDARNLALICRRCHSDYHQGHSKRPLSLAHILLAKKEEDGEVDLAFLAKLRHRAALKEDMAEKFPAWVIEERVKNARLLAARAPFIERDEE
jgi:hypothetical protein